MVWIALLLIAEGTTNGEPFSTQVTMIEMTERMGSPGVPALLDPAFADALG